MYNPWAHAGTGRTSRMMAAARAAAAAGQTVLIMVSNGQFSQFYEEFKNEKNIKIKTIENFPSADRIMQTWRIPGGDPGEKLMMDHYVIEKMYGPLLQELHRYDLEKLGGGG